MNDAGHVVVTAGVVPALGFAGKHAVVVRTMSSTAAAAQRAVERKPAATLPALDSRSKGLRAQIARTHVLVAPAQPIGVRPRLTQDRTLKGAAGERATASRTTLCACRRARKSFRSHHPPTGAMTSVLVSSSGIKVQGIEVVQR
jgi:NADP-dependent 3-hydroxy acid dehydrogenase YdfG